MAVHPVAHLAPRVPQIGVHDAHPVIVLAVDGRDHDWRSGRMCASLDSYRLGDAAVGPVGVVYVHLADEAHRVRRVHVSCEKRHLVNGVGTELTDVQSDQHTAVGLRVGWTGEQGDASECRSYQSDQQDQQ